MSNDELKLIIIIPIVSALLVVIIVLIVKNIIELKNEKANNKAHDELSSFDYFNAVPKYLDALFGESYFELNRSKQVSLQMVSNFASHKEFDYLVKYFGFIVNDETVYNLRELKKYLNKAVKMANEADNKRVAKYIMSYLPSFKMYYISPQGRSSSSYKVTLTPKKVTELIETAEKLQVKQESKEYQRSKLTKDMRDSILRRDNYTCKKCGNSIYNEPNLLLEIDHIIPISKGGKTEPNNLQTLCWRCNRKKSDNLKF